MVLQYAPLLGPLWLLCGVGRSTNQVVSREVKHAQDLGSHELDQCPERLWCCAELDLPFERIDAGMAFGVVETPEYRALNPNGRIPTLEDNGYVLWESNTIVRYLSMKHGLGALCPSDLAARFDAERWMDWQLTTLDRPVRNVFWALVRTAPEKRDPAAVEMAQAEAEQALAIL